MNRSRRDAFTLADLCILLAAVALLLGGALPALLARSREPAHRVRCASNLRQIGQAIQMYAIANGGSLPRAMDDGRGAAPTQYTGRQATDPFKAGGPGPNDVTAALFLLVRSTDLGAEPLVCPTAPGAVAWDLGGLTAQQVSNVPGRQYLSYSYLNVYASPAAVATGFSATLLPTTPPTLAIAADMNPGGSAVTSVTPTASRQQTAAANSRNHNGDGQNVLYANGVVEFQNTPFCGQFRAPAGGAPFRDNIYTHGAGWGSAAGVGVRGSAVDSLDSILLPTALDGPAPVLGTQPATLLIRGMVAALIVGVLLIALSRLRRKPTSAPPSIG